MKELGELYEEQHADRKDQHMQFQKKYAELQQEYMRLKRAHQELSTKYQQQKKYIQSLEDSSQEAEQFFDGDSSETDFEYNVVDSPVFESVSEEVEPEASTPKISFPVSLSMPSKCHQTPHSNGGETAYFQNNWSIRQSQKQW